MPIPTIFFPIRQENQDNLGYNNFTSCHVYGMILF